MKVVIIYDIQILLISNKVSYLTMLLMFFKILLQTFILFKLLTEKYFKNII